MREKSAHTMKVIAKITLLLSISILVIQACTTKPTEESTVTESRTSIEMKTQYGTIVLELYNETPLHRDNFIKLANDGVLDSLLFHRVIENFMIQAGDPESKDAAPDARLGNGGLDYTVDAEFDPSLFHKKGAIGAARDGNLQRASSSTQFYIVQGKVLDDSLLITAENRINGWLAEHYFKNDSANKSLVDSLIKAQENEDWTRYTLFNDSINSLAENYDGFDQYTIPEAHRNVYKTIGGTPHLDQNYTVFGEVVEGLAIVDSIAAVQTGDSNRPVNDVRILSLKVLK